MDSTAHAPSVAVVMPAFCEAEGISGFLSELAKALSEFAVTFIVVDDCSTDATVAIAESADVAGARLLVERMPVNQGHGPTTLRGLRLACDLRPDIVISLDGDGQFVGSDVRRVLDEVVFSDVDVVEGVRSVRDEPRYRSLTSGATRGLVYLRCRQLPADANTPLRAYRRGVLEDLLRPVPDGFMVPNLLMSVNARKSGLRLTEVVVASRSRLGTSTVGTTWGPHGAVLPTKRFVRFCGLATRQWFGSASRGATVRDCTADAKT